jgi:NAD(P)-dependent dehydrogenase (short-subunit alcohol dehydrogenase family)
MASELLVSSGKQKVLITGGLGRIGFAIARRFIQNGHHVVLLDRRELPEKRSKLQNIVQQSQGSGEVIIEDLLPLEELPAKFNRWDLKYGPFDVLINSAGHNAFGNATELNLTAWQAVIDLNLSVPFVLSSHFARSVRLRGNGAEKQLQYRIVNIASTSGLVAEQNTAPYNSSKAGLIQLTKSLAIDFAPLGIAVNAVAPGYVQLEPDDPLYGREPESVVEEYVRHTPLGRGVTLEEIAQAVLFLASPQMSGGITGEIIRVDGGQLAMAVPPQGLGKAMDDLRHERVTAEKSRER